MNINKLPGKISCIFSAATAILVLFQFIILSLNLSQDSGFVHLMDLNKEKNIPAVFSTFGLFLSGMILLLIAGKESGIRKGFWLGLSLIFFFLSYDELFSFHESLIKPIRSHLGVSGYLYFAWVIPYGLITFILLISLYKFLNTLPYKTKKYMILSGLIYVSGALGFELLGAKQYVSEGEVQTFTFRILYTVEESMEMSGVILFLRTIMDYLISKAKNKPKIIQLPDLIIRKENEYRNTGTL